MRPRPAVAVGALFFVNGATFSSWLPRLPEIRDALGLGNAGLGATLLGGWLGGVAGALLVSRALGRMGSRRLLLASAVGLAVCLPLIGIVPAAALLLVALTVLGVLDVWCDVAMNAQGVLVQERSGRSIMNRLHAMWSLGFTAGALVGASAGAADVGVGAQLAATGLVLGVAVLGVRPGLIPEDPPPPAPAERHRPAGARSGRPSRPVTVMALAAVAAIALEATPTDWAAVFGRDELDLGRAAGAGTLALAGAMLVGRLGGDHVLDRVGVRRLLSGAQLLIAVGLAVTVTAPIGAVALVGLVVWGLGLSVVFPQLYATAARLPGTSAGAGLGSMLFGQRLGGMLATAGIGVLAERWDLRVAFAVVAGTAAVILAVTTRDLLGRHEPVPA